VCLGCATWVHRRAVQRHDEQRPSMSARVRDRVRVARSFVMDRGWQDRPVRGNVVVLTEPLVIVGDTGGVARTETLRDAPVRRLPAIRIGVAAGLTGIMCCVGPTVLALVGLVSAGTAFAWATDLYGGYAWWFRFGGLVVLVGLVVWALRRRGLCTLAGVRRVWPRLALALAVAVATYLLLYAGTTWLGTFA
jgi:hypothetical protein